MHSYRQNDRGPYRENAKAPSHELRNRTFKGYLNSFKRKLSVFICSPFLVRSRRCEYCHKRHPVPPKIWIKNKFNIDTFFLFENFDNEMYIEDLEDKCRIEWNKTAKCPEPGRGRRILM